MQYVLLWTAQISPQECDQRFEQFGSRSGPIICLDQARQNVGLIWFRFICKGFKQTKQAGKYSPETTKCFLSPPFTVFLLTVPRRCFFCGSFCYLCFVFIMFSCLFIAVLWSPAGRALTSWLSWRMWCFIVFLSLSHVMSWVRCCAWLYWFLIFLTLCNQDAKQRFNQNGNQYLISQCIYSNIIHKYPSFLCADINI